MWPATRESNLPIENLYNDMSISRRIFITSLCGATVTLVAGCLDDNDDEEAQRVVEIFDTDDYDEAQDNMIRAFDDYDLGLTQPAYESARDAEQSYVQLLQETDQALDDAETRREECLLLTLESLLDRSLAAVRALQETIEAERNQNRARADSNLIRANNQFNRASELAGELADALEHQDGPCS